MANGVAAGMAVSMAWLLHGLLDIPSHPLDIHAGWSAFLGWAIVFIALFSLGHAVVRFFRPITHRPEPDPYTLAQAEVHAARAISLPKQDEQEPRIA